MKTRLCYALTLLGYLGIMVLLIAWYGWLAPPQVFSAPVVILTLGLPLFLVLRGLLHGRPRAVAWSLFLSLFYFTHGIVEAYSNQPGTLAGAHRSRPGPVLDHRRNSVYPRQQWDSGKEFNREGR